jgi:hypothetical protein
MSNQLDTRELQIRLEELEDSLEDYNFKKTEWEEARQALENYRLNEQRNDSDVEAEERISSLEKIIEDTASEMEDAEMADVEELEELQALKDEVGSEWRHGVQLIPEDDFVDYCKEMLEDCGDLPKDLPHYIVIDWDETADNLKADYSETEFRGETYLYRA